MGKDTNDPRWKRRSLEIQDKDGNRCMVCRKHATDLEGDNNMGVHHRTKEHGRDYHDYPDINLITMCWETCHSRLPGARTYPKVHFAGMMSREKYADDIRALLEKDEPLANQPPMRGTAVLVPVPTPVLVAAVELAPSPKQGNAKKIYTVLVQRNAWTKDSVLEREVHDIHIGKKPNKGSAIDQSLMSMRYQGQIVERRRGNVREWMPATLEHYQQKRRGPVVEAEPIVIEPKPEETLTHYEPTKIREPAAAAKSNVNALLLAGIAGGIIVLLAALTYRVITG